jgi:hypothetical protein
MPAEIILSIVIVNWNSRKETLKCLNSIHNISDYRILQNNSEIILVDNYSSDGSVIEIKQKYPDIILVENKINEGYAKAANQGMEITKGKYVLLLGNDTELKDGSLENCINFLDKNNQTGAVGAKLFFPDGGLQGNCKRFPTLKNAFYTYLSLDRLNQDYDMASFKYDEQLKVDQIATTFLMIRRNVLKLVNYFDSQYKILYNDVDLCKKIYNAGYNIYFLPEAVAFHHGSHSTRKAGFKVRKIMYEDIFRYYKNNFGFRAYFLLPVLIIRLLIVSILS